jgi:hypothetical protein
MGTCRVLPLSSDNESGCEARDGSVIAASTIIAEIDSAICANPRIEFVLLASRRKTMDGEFFSSQDSEHVIPVTRYFSRKLVGTVREPPAMG